MNLIFDTHGIVHFNGTPNKTQWVNNRNTVDSLIQQYLKNHQGHLDCLCSAYSSDMRTSFYIVDFMSALPLANEDEDAFVIQGGYERRKGVVTVNYHMYPTRERILHFGIGTTNNNAMLDAND